MAAGGGPPGRDRDRRAGEEPHRGIHRDGGGGPRLRPGRASRSLFRERPLVGRSGGRLASALRSALPEQRRCPAFRGRHRGCRARDRRLRPGRGERRLRRRRLPRSLRDGPGSEPALSQQRGRDVRGGRGASRSRGFRLEHRGRLSRCRRRPDARPLRRQLHRDRRAGHPRRTAHPALAREGIGARRPARARSAGQPLLPRARGRHVRGCERRLGNRRRSGALFHGGRRARLRRRRRPGHLRGQRQRPECHAREPRRQLPGRRSVHGGRAQRRRGDAGEHGGGGSGCGRGRVSRPGGHELRPRPLRVLPGRRPLRSSSRTR